MAATHPQAQMLHNRLRKNLARLRPWARSRHIAAYRIYDRDIPEISLAIDWYDGRLHVSEYAKGRDEEHDPRALFLQEVLAVLGEACGVPEGEVYLKLRQRQRGAAQYEKLDDGGHEVGIGEGGHRFRVNLRDYLDTGLFLDHRDTRRLVQHLSSGARVLNLFGYTGSFTVYAARGGARETVTVDLSRTYLAWAARNLRENEIDPRRHAMLMGDARAYLQQPPEGRFDVIVLDPPTFSNSKRMEGVLDVQADHPELLRRALVHLAPGGALLFSSNYRRLQLQAEQVPEARFTEISEHTVPRDFHDRRVHRCWLVEHAGGPTRAGEVVAVLRR